MFEVNEKVKLTPEALQKYGKHWEFITFVILEIQKNEEYIVRTTLNVPVGFQIQENDLIYA